MLIDIFNWFQSLEGFELILWCIALFFSLFFILQTIVSFFTGGDHGGHDLDGDGDFGHQFFTIKNLIAFFTMFGWAGLAAYKANFSNGIVLLIAFFSGCIIVYIMFLLMQNTAKLKHDGTLQLKNAIDRVGETYLRIPAKRNGIGKVQVQVQGRFMELDAITDDETDIATGKPILVVNTLNNQILLVTSNLVA